jgi:hypothetical protein
MAIELRWKLGGVELPSDNSPYGVDRRRRDGNSHGVVKLTVHHHRPCRAIAMRAICQHAQRGHCAGQNPEPFIRLSVEVCRLSDGLGEG